jgi:hypothetical protein
MFIDATIVVASVTYGHKFTSYKDLHAPEREAPAPTRIAGPCPSCGAPDEGEPVCSYCKTVREA